LLQKEAFFFFIFFLPPYYSVIAKLFCEEGLVKITFRGRQRARAGDGRQKALDTAPCAGTGSWCPGPAPTETSHLKGRGWGGTKPLCPSARRSSQHRRSYRMPPPAQPSSHISSLHSCSPAAFPECCSWLFPTPLGSQLLLPSLLPSDPSMHQLWQPI